MKKPARYVQLRNPLTKNYVKVDRKVGKIVGRKKTPYKNVKLIKNKELR